MDCKNLKDRIQEFYQEVRSVGVKSVKNLKEITINPGTEEKLRLPILQYLIFGKEDPVDVEKPWFNKLKDEEIYEIKSGTLKIRSSPAAFYPELINKFNIMNRLVDLCLFSFDTEALEVAWEECISQAAYDRQSHNKIVHYFLNYARKTTLFQNIEMVVIRGQTGQDNRIPGSDLDLLIFLDNEGKYCDLLKLSMDFCKDSQSGIGSMTFLATEFNNSNSKSFQYFKGNSNKPRLDIYATVSKKELLRVLSGNSVESRWNLEILRNCRPVLRCEQFKRFVSSYGTAIGLQSKLPDLSDPQYRMQRFVSISKQDIQLVQEKGFRALTHCSPKIQMWDSQQVHTFLSPFVAALIVESTQNQNPTGQMNATGAIDYLLETKESGLTWRFAPGFYPQWPPDVDDTACALAALVLVNKNELADFSPNNFSAQEDPTGLLRTWLIPKDELQGKLNDTDPIVTANAAFLLNRLGFWDDLLTQRIEKGIIDYFIDRDISVPKSFYYTQPAIYIYFLARWASTSKSPDALNLLVQIKAKIRTFNVGELALTDLAAIISVAVWTNAREILSQYLPTLMSFQNQEGMWPVAPFFVDPSGSTYGSAEVTTAMALRAINLCLD